MKLKLTKNLRRNILRGHPWLYKDAIGVSSKKSEAAVAQVFDHKDSFVGWGIYDPKSPLACRMLSTEKAKPDTNFFKSRLSLALSRRQHFDRHQTNAYRLVNGEGDSLPGLIIDLYDHTAILQFDGQGMSEFWQGLPLTDWLTEYAFINHVIIKSRTHDSLVHLTNKLPSTTIQIRENNAIFEVDIERGQKTGFFLDQRDNRYYISQICKNLTVLNLFSYTGGFSIYAGLGKAKHVTSVDISQGAIESCQKNWLLNQLEESKHSAVSEDVFKYLNQLSEKQDMILVDPPSMAHSQKTKAAATKKYIEAFSKAAKHVKPQGHLVLSSCSSHISFEDFFHIITESLSNARRQGQILRVSGQGADHPFLHILHEMRYLKFVHLTLN